jgi:hypothetical protein
MVLAVARAQRIAGVSREFGFNPDDPGPRQQRPDRDGDAGDHAAATHRDEDGGRRTAVSRREVFGDLKADRALPGDYIPVIERRDLGVASCPRDVPRGFCSCRQRGRDRDQFRARAPDQVGLDPRSGVGHDDGGGDPQEGGGVGDGEPVVAA